MTIKQKHFLEFMRILSSHNDMIVTTGEKDLCRVKVKPARKGIVYGRGSDKIKETQFTYRASVVFTSDFKRELDKYKALNV